MGDSSEGKISTLVRYLFHGESDIPTPGNPFTNPGINITRPFCYLRGKCSFRLIFLYWRTFPVGSIYISVRFMFVKPHDVPPLLCFNVQTEMKFCAEQLLFTTPTIWKHGLVLVCTLKQSDGGYTLCGFTNIKSNQNMSGSDWKCSPIHKYWLNQSK